MVTTSPIIDAGRRRPDVGTATLVTRACYLALRRAIAVSPAPDNVIVIEEPCRALDRDDVAAVLGVPVLAVIPADHGVARVVDAGLLTARLPDAFSQLRDAIAVSENATT